MLLVEPFLIDGSNKKESQPMNQLTFLYKIFTYLF